MGKKSRKKQAKQKLLQQQRSLTLPTDEQVAIEELSNQEIFKLQSEHASSTQFKKEKFFPSHYLHKTMLKKSKKIFAYIIVSLSIFLGLFGLYKLATRPLPGTPVADLGNEHIPSVTTPHSPYNSKPPTSGPHVGPKANWGVHDKQIPDELQLHNLEDGGVLIQYDCDGQDCSDLVEKLKKIVSKYKEKVILAPYAGLDQTIALTAWNRIDAFSEFDEKRITAFIGSYRGIDHHKQ